MTVLDVHPVGYDTAARVLGEDVAGGVGAAVDVLVAALEPCAGMAGTDDTALTWAPHYDSGAHAAVRAFGDLTNGAYRLAALLEQCAINYAGAEAACLPHETAWQTQARWAHLSVAPPDPPPPAAGAPLPEPDGWSLLAHLIGRLWPNGHQDLLHVAAAAWGSAAATLQDLSPVVERAAARIAAEQQAPEVADAVTVLAEFGISLDALALHCRALSDECSTLAHDLDEAHSRIIHECAEFVAITAAAEAAGGVLCVVTAGLSEAAAQAVAIRAGVAAASVIRAAIDTFGAVVVGVAADLDALAARFAAVSADVEPVLARSVVTADVVRPGVAGVAEQRAISTAVSRLENSVHVSPIPPTWAKPATLLRHFDGHAAEVGARSVSEYAAMANDFLARSRLEGLPTKIDNRGIIRIYDPETGLFGSYDSAGRTITFFKPTSKTYWQRQKGTLR